MALLLMGGSRLQLIFKISFSVARVIQGAGGEEREPFEPL